MNNESSKGCEKCALAQEAIYQCSRASLARAKERDEWKDKSEQVKAQNKELILEIKIRDGLINDEQGMRATVESKVIELETERNEAFSQTNRKQIELDAANLERDKLQETLTIVTESVEQYARDVSRQEMKHEAVGNRDMATEARATIIWANLLLLEMDPKTRKC